MLYFLLRPWRQTMRQHLSNGVQLLMLKTAPRQSFCGVRPNQTCVQPFLWSWGAVGTHVRTVCLLSSCVRRRHLARTSKIFKIVLKIENRREVLRRAFLLISIQKATFILWILRKCFLDFLSCRFALVSDPAVSRLWVHLSNAAVVGNLRHVSASTWFIKACVLSFLSVRLIRLFTLAIDREGVDRTARSVGTVKKHEMSGEILAKCFQDAGEMHKDFLIFDTPVKCCYSWTITFLPSVLLTRWSICERIFKIPTFTKDTILDFCFKYLCFR